LLSEPKMIVTADLVLNEHLEPSTRRCGDGDTPEKMAEYTSWSREYYEVMLKVSKDFGANVLTPRFRHYLLALLHINEFSNPAVTRVSSGLCYITSTTWRWTGRGYLSC